MAENRRGGDLGHHGLGLDNSPWCAVSTVTLTRPVASAPAMAAFASSPLITVRAAMFEGFCGVSSRPLVIRLSHKNRRIRTDRVK